MKRMMLLFLLLAPLLACDKDDEEPQSVELATNSIADDLQLIIRDENVLRLKSCTEGTSCFGISQATNDFDFPGENFIRIGNQYFNLQQLIRLETSLEGPSNNRWVMLRLWFPS